MRLTPKSEICATGVAVGRQQKNLRYVLVNTSGWQTTEKSIIKKENEHSPRQCRFSFFLIWRDMQYDNQIKLQSAVKAVIKEYENYKKNLMGKSMLVIYRNRTTMQLDHIIINFTGNNYYHLTGLAYKEDNGESTKNKHFASRFHNDLEDKKLSFSDLKIKDNNTALKIKALPFISSQYRYCNMTGNFNESGIKLQLDKVVGNTSTCLGLKHISGKNYVPASSLYGDTRKYAQITHQKDAILIKETNDTDKYKTIKYVAKGHDLKNLTYNDELKKLFSLEQYKSAK